MENISWSSGKENPFSVVPPKNETEERKEEVVETKSNDKEENETEQTEYTPESIRSDAEPIDIVIHKNKSGFPLTKEDLTCLYEIDRPIKRVGRSLPPHIEKIRAQRNQEEDMLILFECTPDQIAHSLAEINEDTKAYVGVLVPGILAAISKYTIDHVYTSFPEGKIRSETLEIGGKSADRYITDLKQEKITISSEASAMMHHETFITSPNPESLGLVRLKVSDLGFTKNPTTNQIYARADELGLDLCPPETGPAYQVKHLDLPDFVRIGMEQIPSRDGRPSVFLLTTNFGPLFDTAEAYPEETWGTAWEVVFSLRKEMKEV